MVLLGNSYDQLERWQELIMKDIRKNKNLAAIESDYSKNKPEIKLIINRKKAQDLGVSIRSIGSTISKLVNGNILVYAGISSAPYILYKEHLCKWHNQQVDNN